MRYVLSTVSLLLALMFFGLGVGQRTIWAPPDSFAQSVEERITTPVLLLDGSVMNQHIGSETLEVEHAGDITVIIARTHDLVGWISGTPYTLATGGAGQAVVLETFAGDSEELPESLESDLWQEVHTGVDSVSVPMDLPAGVSVAVIGDREGPAPSDVRVVWPNVATYPLFGPFMTAGFALLAFSLLFLVLGLRNHRRKRGPQRATAKALTRGERRAIARGKAPAIVPPAAANTASEPPALETGAHPVVDADTSVDDAASAVDTDGDAESEGGDRA